MQSLKSLPFAVLLNAVSTHEISSAVVLVAAPHLLQLSVHEEPDVTRNPSTAGALSKTASANADILDCQSPSMVDRKQTGVSLFLRPPKKKQKASAAI